MKKLLCILATLLMLAGGSSWYAYAGDKVIKSQHYSIVVPECAPEFLNESWDESLITMGVLENGVGYAILGEEKEDMKVRVLVFKFGKEKPNIMAFSVAYKGEVEAQEFYFDKAFLETHKPSGRFAGPVSFPKQGEQILKQIVDIASSLDI